MVRSNDGTSTLDVASEFNDTPDNRQGLSLSGAVDAFGQREQSAGISHWMFFRLFSLQEANAKKKSARIGPQDEGLGRVRLL